MKRNLAILLLPLLCILSSTVFAQKQKPLFVIVHGAWGGGWAFKKVDSLLTAKGCNVYRPTLTGQGERVHLASPDVGLDTHIKDVVNTILFEELDNVVLVGHSYGGMVVTGIADSIPERLSKLIYLDAFVPENGESLTDITGELDKNRFKIVDGGVVPPWIPEGQQIPKDVPHPHKTLTDKLLLTNKMRTKIPTHYILTVDIGRKAKDDAFFSQADRARKKGWPVLQLEADHNAQWSAPEELVKMVLSIANK